MPFLGSTPPANYKTLTKQTITGDGSTSYTLDSKVANGNEIEVFVNNVRQEPGTDYSANNNTITFTTALTSSDSCWLIFQSKAESTSTITNDNYGGAINVNTSAADNSVNIDASGNAIIGATAYTGNTTNKGGGIRNDGLVFASVTQGSAAVFNRLGTDGDIALFRKDGTSIGSIGVAAGDNIYFAGETGSTGGIYINNGAVYPAATGGAATDTALDLGSATIRWKDLYLSNAIYLGGTSSANALDDYEEGTWTPGFESYGGTSLTVSSASGMYTKIGRFVMVTWRLNVTSSGSGISSGAMVTNLPFTAYSNISPATSYDFVGAGGTLSNSGAFTSGDQVGWSLDGGRDKINLVVYNQGSISEIPTNAFSGDESMRMTAYYFTS